MSERRGVDRRVEELILRWPILADRLGRPRSVDRAFRASDAKHFRRRRSAVSTHDETINSLELITSL
jgi:hypothetical protein